MRIDLRGKGAMENIFYAALALHVAGKPINKANIRSVLEAAGTPVDETALDAMSVLVEALETARQKKEKPVDPRIVKLLTSKLAQQKVQISNLEAVLAELDKSMSLSKSPGQAINASRPPEGTIWVAPEKPVSVESMKRCDGAASESLSEELEPTIQSEGRYVYGIAATGKKVKLGPIGIDSSDVYTIPYRDLCAIVHNCTAEPYQSKNEDTVKSWVIAHQGVLDEAKEQFGTVVPLGFDTILHPKDNMTPIDQVVKDWLKEDYSRLWSMIERIQCKNEYVVQVSYEPSLISKRISEQNEEIRKLREETDAKSLGMAYVLKQRLEKTVKAETERLADEWFKDFYGRIKRHTDDIIVDKTKKPSDGKVMLLNVSCLLSQEKVHDLGEELEGIENTEGFSVHFSGPWPPYSFVSKPVAPAEVG